MGKLYALADIHLSFPANREALSRLKPHPGDSIILAGDIGETPEHLHLAFQTFKPLFDKIWWVPGNHELYSLPHGRSGGNDKGNPTPRGEAKYSECVEIARSYGVLTPDDEFAVWEGEGGPVVVAPVFTLYDYSFRPPHVSREGALAWAREEGLEATDETLLHPDPYATRDEWCEDLVEKAEVRLEAAALTGLPLVIVNHWPLKQQLAQLFLIPRFSIWCGTTKTEQWHKRFGAKVVVTGHLHIRRTDWIDGCRFEECSLGYPKQWKGCQEKGLTMNDMLREILPGPEMPDGGNAPTQWRRFGEAVDTIVPDAESSLALPSDSII